MGSGDPDGEGVPVGMMLGEAEADGEVVDGVAIDELGMGELGIDEASDDGIAPDDEAEAEADGDALPVTATLVMSVQSIGRK